VRRGSPPKRLQNALPTGACEEQHADHEAQDDS